MLFRTRDLLVRQRTQTINSVRGQLAEFGVIAAQGVASVAQLRQGVAEAQEVPPDQVVSMANLLFEQIATFNEKIAGLDRDICARAREQEEIKRLMTIPGVGPICAMAVNAFAPPMESFRRGRDFAAWIGLTPRQNSTAGKQRLGRITKMGQRDLRRLLILGATAVVWQNSPAQGGVGSLAPKDDRGKAAEAGRCRTGQQYGPHHLGAVDQERDLPGTGRGWRCGVGDREEKRTGKGTPGSADALLNA